MTNLGSARQIVGDQVALQGNLDLAVLLASNSQIKDEADRIMTSFGKIEDGSGYVFNLGHGISKDTRAEAVEAVHQF